MKEKGDMTGGDVFSVTQCTLKFHRGRELLKIWDSTKFPLVKP